MYALHGIEYEIGSIRIRPLDRTLRRDGRDIPLAPRAFDVLLLLVERRGEVVLKSELIARLWPDTHVDESSLPVMISTIRRAIGDDGRRQQIIQTVSKSGYRLIGEIREICPEPPPAPALAPLRNPVLKMSGLCALTAFTALLLTGSIGPGANRTTAVIQLSHAPSAALDLWYEKGRYAWDLQTKSGILQSIEYYQKAIAENPRYALAWAGLAESYVSLPSYSERTSDQALGQAKSAAGEALALNNRLADSHIAAGMVALIADRNFAGGERELRAAIAFDPASPLAQGELALCLVSTGRTDEAVSHAQRAKELNPLSIRAATDLGIVFYYGHRYSEAQAEFEEVLKLDPYSYRAHINLGKAYLSLGRFTDALRVFEEASFLSDHDPLAEGLMAEARALQGDRDGARSILAKLEQKDRTAYVAPISLAFANAGLGRLDAALANLKKAHRDRTIAALFLRVDPNWEVLHDKKDFQDLVNDVPDNEQPQEDIDSAGK